MSPEEKMRIYGLRQAEWDAICGVFQKHEDVERVVLYGSRAKGDFRPGSDIDLTITGPSMTTKELNRIATALDDLLLPYAIDLSIYHQIDNSSLLDHIARIGKVIYSK